MEEGGAVEMSAEGPYELPKGWEWTNLANIADIFSGNGFPKKYQGKSKGQIPFFKVMDISKTVLNGNIHLKIAGNYISFDECEEIRAKPFKKGTIVFAKIGEAIKLNRRAILGQDSLVDNNVMGITASSKEINNLFIFYFFLTVKLGDYSRATAVPSVRKSDVELIAFPLPPYPEQRRIVTRIEELFTQLDAGISALKTSQAQLKRYRQSVLKAAVEGKLTEKWRADHPDVEPASVLLERIGKERRAKWEEDELAKMVAKGKRPKNDRWKQKYKAPQMPKTEGLPELPEGWTWVTSQMLSNFGPNSICAGPFGTIFKAKDFRSSGIPIIFLRHVSPGRYLTHKPTFMDKKKWYELFEPYSVYGGELLVTKLGEPPGVCAIYPIGIGPAMVTPDVIKISINEKISLPRFIMHYFNSDRSRKLASGAAFGTTRLRLTLPIFRNMSIPLPPLSEQHEIVSEVERRLSVADQAEATIATNLKRAARLRQSILKKAFRGELVPQDTNDEPASILLERIRAERAKSPPKKRRVRPRKNSGQKELI